MIICSLDYGGRYIGIAVTDSEGILALRHSVIDQKKDEVLIEIPKIIKDNRIDKIILGMPRSLSGVDTPQTRDTRMFLTKLRTTLPDHIAIEEVDETFTSKEAERIIHAEGGQKIDAHAEAARLMLVDYLIKSSTS